MASGDEIARESMDGRPAKLKEKKRKKKKAGEEDLHIEGYSIGGLSIAGHETCVILPSLNLAFDIGKCPQRAVSQQFLFISHGHMDHIVSSKTRSIGGFCNFYVGHLAVKKFHS